MTTEIGLMLAIIGVTIVLFSLEKISPDVIALGLLAVLVLTNLLPIEEAFSGFASDTFILILSMLVITAALEKTGAVDAVSEQILQRAGTHPKGFMITIMLAAAVLSTFMNNHRSSCLLSTHFDWSGGTGENFAFQTVDANGIWPAF